MAVDRSQLPQFARPASRSGIAQPRGVSREVAISNVNPVRALGENLARTKFEIQNNSGSVIRRGYDASMRTGMRVAPSTSYVDTGPGVYRGEVWLLADVPGPLNIDVAEESE